MDNYSIEKLKRNFEKNNSEFIDLKCKTIYKLNKNMFFGLDWGFKLNIFDFIVNEEKELVFCLEFLNVKKCKEGLNDFESEFVKFLSSYCLYLDEKKRKYPTTLETLQEKKPIPKENKHLSKNWFKIGVKFATGEVQKIYKENNCVATQTAMQLGNKNLRPYISESISNTNFNDKNIFSRKQKDIDLIINYCNENSLTICDDFNNKLLQRKQFNYL
ncbi:MAG: hypothetical protein RSC72_15090 [Algoriella sp.]|uniref:hypothetical protein n=1 Tax=Algoriella sp. TaxID=1872434 RepID=UPI002FC7771E